MGQVIRGIFDRMVPLPFDIEPDAARRMNADVDMAKVVRDWAQQKVIAAQRDLSPDERADLLAIHGRIFNHPEP